MPYMQRSDLGRDVPVEDWTAFHRDRFLKCLVQMKDLGVRQPSLSQKEIEGITGLQPAYAAKLGTILRKLGFLSYTKKDGYQLTEKGELFVRDSPSERRCPRCGYDGE